MLKSLSVIRPFMGEDHDNEVRLIAIQTAGLLRDSAILEELKSVATDEEDDEIRIAAVIAIGHLGDKTGLNFLEPLLDDENDEIIEAVSAAIELLNKPEEIVSTPQLPIESHDLTEEPQSVIVDEAGSINYSVILDLKIIKCESKHPVYWSNSNLYLLRDYWNVWMMKIL